MVIIGPDFIQHGVDPETVIMGSGDMAYCGPSEGPSNEVDPVSRIFVLLGKIIAARRIAVPDQIGEHRPAAIETFGALQEVVLGYTDRTAEYELVWAPLARSVQAAAIDPLAHHAEDLTQRTRRFIASETGTVLGVDPAASVEQRMEALDLYLQMRGLTLEASSNGFRDYIAKFFTDADGKRMNLPASANPSFPDSWITPIPVDPAAHGGSRREWNIVW